MTDENDDDDKADHKKPLRAGQYPKGQSGNLLGRPKGSRNIGHNVSRQLRKTLPVNEGGKTRRMSKSDLAAIQLTNKAAKGDLNAIKLISYLTKVSDDQSIAAKIAALSQPNDAAVIAEIVKRIRAADVPPEGKADDGTPEPEQ